MHNHVMPKIIGATELKQHCLRLLDTLEPEGLVVTKRGKPVARVTPIRGEFADFIGSMKGRVQIRGDILSTGRTWKAAGRGSPEGGKPPAPRRHIGRG